MPIISLLLLSCSFLTAAALPSQSLILDLDAAKGITLENDGKISSWKNQIAGSSAAAFVKQDKGRKEPGSGCPELRKNVAELGGKPSVVFRRQELICMEEDAFDGLTTGKGHTWIAVIAVHKQKPGLKDVNSFFGNLRNGGKYEGLWGCLNDDNTPWYGVRNGITLGRFDENNPQLLGPRLETGKFHLLAGRMAAGTGKAKLEFYVNRDKPAAEGIVPVSPEANPSKMAIGQERDAVEHPGHESFDGEIARFLIWERPLENTEMTAAMAFLRKVYGIPDP